VGPARFDSGNFVRAAELFSKMATSQELEDFLTLPAYDMIIQHDLIKPSL
jgi:malate synthase